MNNLQICPGKMDNQILSVEEHLVIGSVLKALSYRLRSASQVYGKRRYASIEYLALKNADMLRNLLDEILLRDIPADQCPNLERFWNVYYGGENNEKENIIR